MKQLAGSAMALPFLYIVQPVKNKGCNALDIILVKEIRDSALIFEL
jgi:hypothetical protein